MCRRDNGPVPVQLLVANVTSTYFRDMIKIKTAPEAVGGLDEHRRGQREEREEPLS